LHSKDAIAELEGEVVAGVLDDRAEYGDSELGCRGSYRGLRYCPFAVR
jgi:hypothetical protein